MKTFCSTTLTTIRCIQINFLYQISLFHYYNIKKVFYSFSITSILGEKDFFFFNKRWQFIITQKIIKGHRHRGEGTQGRERGRECLRGNERETEPMKGRGIIFNGEKERNISIYKFNKLK